MLAARAYEGETLLKLEEVPKPTAEPGDVVVKIEAAGMSHSAIGIWHHGMMPVLPRTLGPQGAGIVDSVGANVDGVAVGDRVRIEALVTCRKCEYCLSDRSQYCDQATFMGHLKHGRNGMEMHKRYLDGTLAEYIRVPGWAVDRMPDSMSFESAAKVHDIADALRAMKVAQIPPGGTLAVTAATGVMGIAMVRMARLVGVGRLIAIGRSAERLAAVRDLAPDLVETVALEDLDESWQENDGLTKAIWEIVPEGPDSVIDFLSSGAGTWQAIESLKDTGTGALMGGNQAPAPSPLKIMHMGWKIVGTRSYSHLDARQVMQWLGSGVLKIDDLITHRFDLADMAEAERLVTERYEPAWSVIVYPETGRADAARKAAAATAAA